MQKHLKKYKIEIIIFTLATLVRLAFFFVCLNHNNGNIPDTVHGQDGYFEISKNLLEGHGFSASASAPQVPYSYGVPLYPYFLYFLLWLTGGSYLAVGMIQLLIGAFLPILAMRLSKLILPDHPRVAIATALVFAFSPFQILFSFIFYTETIFTLLFSLFLIAYLRFLKTPTYTLASLAGILLGLSTLTKATVQYLPIVAVVFALYHFRKNITKGSGYKLGLMLALFTVVISPWLYRNHAQFGETVLSTQMPFNIYGVLLPSVRAVANNTSFKVEQEKLQINGGELMSNTAKTRELAALATSEIVGQPAAFVKLSALSLLTFFTHDGMLTFLQAAGIRPEVYPSKPAIVLLLESPGSFLSILGSYMKTSMSLVFLARIAWTLVFIAFLFGLGVFLRARKITSEMLFAVGIVFYFALTTLINGLAVNARFRMPIEVFYLPIAIIGASVAWQMIRRAATQTFSHER